MTTNWIADSAGNWGDSGNWDNGVPDATKDAVFSNAHNGNCTVNVTATAKSLDFTGGTGYTGTFSGSSALAVSGNVTFASTMTATYSGYLTINASATLETNNKTLSCAIDINGVDITVVLGTNNLNIGSKSFRLLRGNFDCNQKNLSCGTISANQTFSGTLTYDSSTITCDNIVFTGLNFALVDDSSSSLIGSGSFQSKELTYNNLSLISTSSKTDTLSGDITVDNNLTIQGTIVGRHWISSNLNGTQRTITCNGTVSIDNADFADIKGAGSGDWDLSAGSVGNAGGNSGITFTTPVTRYWVGNTGNWNSTGEWSASSGGASGASVPLCHDTAIFDANSFDNNGYTVTMNMDLMCATTFADTDQTFNLAFSQNTYIFGSQTWDSNLTVSGTARSLYFSNRSDCTFTPTTAGENNAMNMSSIYLRNIGCKVTLLDDLNITGAANNIIIFDGGTFDANDYDVTCKRCSSNVASTYYLGNGTWTLTGYEGAIFDANGSDTIYAEGSTIIINNTDGLNQRFDGEGKTFNNLSFTGTGIFTITGSNSFNDLTVDTTNGANTIKFTAGTTTTVSSLTFQGYDGKTLTACSTSSTNATLSDSSGTNWAYYADIDDLTATGGADWFYENSTATDSPGWSPPITKVSVEDVGSGSDTSNLLAKILIQDSGEGSELINILTELAVSDTSLGSDAVSILCTLAVSDTGAGSDAISSLVKIAISDTGTASEALAFLVQILLQETSSANEVISIINSLTIQDSGLGTDTINTKAVISILDSGLGTELIDILRQVIIDDTGSGTEALDLLVKLTLVDDSTGNDTLSILNQFNITDSGLGEDLISILNKMTILDSGLGTEALNLLAKLTISDTGLGTEALNLIIDVALSDSGVGSDAINILSSLMISDSGLGLDIVSILAQIALSDTGSSLDAVNILAKLNISDSGVGSDIISMLITIALSDSSISSDAVSILAKLTIQDSAIGNEILEVLVSMLISDTSNASDIISILNNFSITDTGSGIDQISILTKMLVTDSGVSNDSLSIITRLGINDSSIGEEVLQILTNLTIQDTGIGNELISILNNFLITDTAQGVDTKVVKAYLSRIRRLMDKKRILKDGKILLNSENDYTDIN